MSRCRLVILVLMLGPLLAFASEEERIAGLYARGLGGEKQAVIDCITALESKLAAQPGDQRARVYLGSAWTLRSRDLSFGPGKLAALRKGIALMDEAAAAAPNDSKVLLLRAVTNESLPGFLGRGKIARQQLDQLLVTVEKNRHELGLADRQLLYLNAGKAAQRSGDKGRAIDLWQRGLAIAADPRLTAEIRQALGQP
jgi:hypothetical protein